MVMLGIVHTCTAGFNSDAVDCLIATQEILVRSSAGTRGV